MYADESVFEKRIFFLPRNRMLFSSFLLAPNQWEEWWDFPNANSFQERRVDVCYVQSVCYFILEFVGEIFCCSVDFLVSMNVFGLPLEIWSVSLWNMGSARSRSSCHILSSRQSSVITSRWSVHYYIISIAISCRTVDRCFVGILSDSRYHDAFLFNYSVPRFDPFEWIDMCLGMAVVSETTPTEESSITRFNTIIASMFSRCNARGGHSGIHR